MTSNTHFFQKKTIVSPAVFACALLLFLCGCVPHGFELPGKDFFLPAKRIPLSESTSTGETQKKYIFYLHSFIIEEQGPYAKSKRHGLYNYYGILDSLERRGFRVISEVRPKGTSSYEYAKKVGKQIDKLLQAGVPPENITVAGLLKGGIISIYTSAIIKNPKINYVILSGCGKGKYIDAFFSALKQTEIGIEGNFLSIYDSISPVSGTCEPVFEAAAAKINSHEISLISGLGTGLFYSPANHWMNPMVKWINKE